MFEDQRPTVGRSEFISELAWRTGLSIADARTVTDAFLDILTDRLRNNQAVVFENFGTFMVKKSGGRMGRNPRRGKLHPIPAMYSPMLRASRCLREEATRSIQKVEPPKARQNRIRAPTETRPRRPVPPRREVLPPRGYGNRSAKTAGSPGMPYGQPNQTNGCGR